MGGPEVPVASSLTGSQEPCDQAIPFWDVPLEGFHPPPVEAGAVPPTEECSPADLQLLDSTQEQAEADGRTGHLGLLISHCVGDWAFSAVYSRLVDYSRGHSAHASDFHPSAVVFCPSPLLDAVPFLLNTCFSDFKLNSSPRIIILVKLHMLLFLILETNALIDLKRFVITVLKT